MREFNSFGTFARHLKVTAALGEEVTHHITETAANIVKKDAKNRIGTYQDRSGNFAAWEPLAESTVADRVAKGYTPNDPLLREGVLRDSIEAETHGNEAVVGSTDEVALYQEVGTEHIPPRAFLGPALYENKNAISVMAGNTVLAWISGVGWHRPAKLISEV